ncbi:MAG: type II toxin-antitoxin system Phd/YefM family antitoxin [Patescibacteria group bacterium]|jgi:prevent-host-death family protein|nr:type II toxin-antitoxin system Phd/YefM family antitoxin [Patescibacteria group bacterium]
MPIIKSISDLRNKSNTISDIVHNANEPVFITRNGEGDMVVMSMAKYGQLQLQVNLMEKLAAAQADYAKGDRGRSLNDVVDNLRSMLSEQRTV